LPQSVFSEVGIAHAYSSFLCTLYTTSICNSLFKNALPQANFALLDSAYALKLINEVSVSRPPMQLLCAKLSSGQPSRQRPPGACRKEQRCV
jgi:hypothetical protein